MLQYYYDTETGFYYLQTRYYDPEVGRFLNMDSVDYADPESLDGLNLYAYCNNNPVMYVDPTGTSILAALVIGFFIGALFGGTARAIGTAAKGGSFKDCLAAFAGGAIIGGLLGVASVLGGGLVVGAYTATTASILGVTTFLTVGTFVGGMGAYWAESAIKGESFSWRGALISGALTFTQGLLSFGIGMAMGAAGFYNSLKAGNGLRSSINSVRDFFVMERGKFGVKGVFYGIVNYTASNAEALAVRTFMKSIFTFPWNLVRP